MPEYRYVGTHAVEVYSGDKCVMLAPGELVTLSAEDMESNAEIENQLLPTAEKKGGK
jgi:hypothetical protein